MVVLESQKLQNETQAIGEPKKSLYNMLGMVGKKVTRKKE
jgi:hypothetical protein